MVTAATVKGLANRLEKAEQLIAGGAVFPVAGLEGYAVVRNGNGDSMYLVRFTDGFQHCTCPDFAHRQKDAGLPCKHILAAELALGSNLPQPGDDLMEEIWDEILSEQPTTDIEPWRAEGHKVDPAIGSSILRGERTYAN